MIRCGTGYDAHRLAAGRKLILGGVDIPHDRGLEGHSDADVLCHAIADALLGAIGERDIGHHFPNSDESIRGISSLEILRKVTSLMHQAKSHETDSNCKASRQLVFNSCLTSEASLYLHVFCNFSVTNKQHSE